MSPNPFPASLPRDHNPQRRGTQEQGKGKTPLYYLAWRVNPHDIVAGKRGYRLDSLRLDFVGRWSAKVLAKPDSGERKRPQPTFKMWLGGLEDEDVYYVVATNRRHPATIMEEDIQYARDALPSFDPDSEVDLDSDEVFRWYRVVKS
ncbi:hypothetical protein HMN09_01147000 [Mycena chlorophos]|uniref:Uncharacterized protein n=1 Tax=Mycena chlorophos TaxID=658473 RepID=A0A8H6S787_MYCCL|nr:hypothetical protein HMN09_01147000 [Mycena chlorophos]